MAKKNLLSRGGAGGGFGSNKHTQVGVRYGAAREGRNPRAVSQIGQAMGNHTTEHTEKLRREDVIERMRYPAPAAAGVPLGNSVAMNVGRGGPGTGRNLYGQAGTNKVYGPVTSGVTPTPGERITGHDILADYGPEVRRR